MAAEPECGGFMRLPSSYAHAVDLFQRDLTLAAVIQPRRPGGLMVGHLLCNLQLPAVAQVFRDTGGPEAVTADAGTDTGRRGTSPYHPENVRLRHRRV